MEFIDSTTPKPKTPTIPYRLKTIEGFGGVKFTYKAFSNGSLGDVVGDDEKAWVAYAEHLEAENAKLKAELAVANQTRVLLDVGPPATSNETPLEPVSETPTADVNSSNTPSTPGENAVLHANDVLLAETDAATDPRRQRAEEELLKSPADSNGTIGERIGASDEFVRKIRKRLESEGRFQAAGEVPTTPTSSPAQ